MRWPNMQRSGNGVMPTGWAEAKLDQLTRFHRWLETEIDLTMDSPDQAMTADDAADLLGLEVKAVHRWCRSGVKPLAGTGEPVMLRSDMVRGGTRGQVRRYVTGEYLLDFVLRLAHS